MCTLPPVFLPAVEVSCPGDPRIFMTDGFVSTAVSECRPSCGRSLKTIYDRMHLQSWTEFPRIYKPLQPYVFEVPSSRFCMPAFCDHLRRQVCTELGVSASGSTHPRPKHTVSQRETTPVPRQTCHRKCVTTLQIITNSIGHRKRLKIKCLRQFL